MATSPYLPKCETKISTESGKCSRFTYAVSNCQGWRITQEDAHLAIADLERNTSIFAVFDGHNGPEVASFAAKYLPKHLLKNKNYRSGNIERGIQESFMALDELLLNDEANELLIQYRERSCFKIIPNMDGTKAYPFGYFTGSTAVVMLIKNDIYYCANIGDSRCIVCRDGHARQLSKDHKPDEPEERERIEKAGGSIIHGRINMGIDVSRSFGDHWYKRNRKLTAKEQMIIAWPHTTVEKIHPNDQFIVLICDGIWNAIDNQDLIDFISKRLAIEEPLNKICEGVIKQILPTKSMPKFGIAGKDNMTIMIIKRMSNEQQSNLMCFSAIGSAKFNSKKEKSEKILETNKMVPKQEQKKSRTSIRKVEQN